MKKILLRFALLALLPLARAAAVNPASVAGDAQWLVYADFNALRDSTLGQELLEFAEKAQLDTGHGKIGLDWKKLSATLGSATAYGTTLSPDPKQIDGALLLQGTPDLRKIAESLLLQLNLAHPEIVAELTDLPFPAYEIKEPKSPAGKAGQTAIAAEPLGVIVAFPPEAVILVSKSKPQLLKARDVFRGAAPSLAKNAAAPLAKFARNAEGAYLFAASTVPAEKLLTEEGPQTRILKMANSGSLAIGERGGEMFARAELGASSDQMADKLMKIVQGMTAMMSLAETSDKQLAEFLNSANVTRDGKNVAFSLAYSSARLSQMIKGLQQTAAKPEPRAVPQPVSGRTVATWTATASAEPEVPGALATRTIDDVEIKNGATVTLGWRLNGGQGVRYDRVEIAPAGGGMPLVFRPDMMRANSNRGAFTAQFQFPGADGNYTLKVAYANDPEGKATYAVSVREPKSAETDRKNK